MKLKKSKLKKLIIEYLTQDNLLDACQTASLAHLGQKRRDGSDYIMHPLAVRDMTAKYYPDNIAAQMLSCYHDSLEDGPGLGNVTEDELYQYIRGDLIGASEEEIDNLINALLLMTHDKEVDPVYEDYLAKVFSNPLASIVKISDLIHNLSHNPSPRQIIKYRTALNNVSPPAHINIDHLEHLNKILLGST
tara:strand:- start:58 stop:630 length:573 start_codon:yes stop_codon:yes gene_type:complete